jgi:hypothetical protein
VVDREAETVSWLDLGTLSLGWSLATALTSTFFLVAKLDCLVAFLAAKAPFVISVATPEGAKVRAKENRFSKLNFFEILEPRIN